VRAAIVCDVKFGIRGQILRKKNLHNLHTDKAFVLDRRFVQWCGKGQILLLKIPQVVFNHFLHRLEQLFQARSGCSTTSLRNAAAKISLGALSHFNRKSNLSASRSDVDPVVDEQEMSANNPARLSTYVVNIETHRS